MKLSLNGLSLTKKDIRKINRALFFIIKLNIFLIPLYVISIFQLNWFFLQKSVAVIVHWLLNISGVFSSLNGVQISIPLASGSFSGFINWDCTAWKSIIAFLALLIASNIRNFKAYLLVFLVFLVNIFRIWLVFYLTFLTDANYFSLIHNTLFSFGMIVTVLLLWAVSFKVFKKRESD